MSTFAKPSPAPPIAAVPQSGPMTSTSLASASSFSRRSWATVTPSLKIMTGRPASMASRASKKAYSPGVETSTRSAGPRAAAERVVSGGCSSEPVPGRSTSVSRRSASSAAASGSFARTAISRSPGSVSGTPKPISRRIETLRSVAMATMAASTPGSSDSARLTRMRVTESW
ncbi:hypothetical protein [Nonomuraea rubra]|uniref:hypothetical protein n=1 Tax=Nonomuraea rubra TaxID=46180 RepID=UPI0031EBE150